MNTPICTSLKEKVMQCYEANHGQTLMCSQEARAFVECVDQYRGVHILEMSKGQFSH